MRPVVGGPRQSQQVALTLPSPQREQQGQMQVLRRDAQESSFVAGGPNLVSARPSIEPATADTGVCQHQAPIMCPGENAGKHGPGVIGLPSGGNGELVAPRQKL